MKDYSNTKLEHTDSISSYNSMLTYIIEHFPFPILLVSKEESIVYANLFASHLFGYEKNELIGKKFYDLTSPEYIQSDLSILSDFQKNTTFLSTLEKKVLHKLGQEIWVKQTVVPIKFQSEVYNYLIFTLENISLQKARQEFAIEKEDLFYSFFHQNNAIKLLIDPLDASIIDANQAACDFYGYSRDELLKMKIFDINAMTKEQIQLELEKAHSTKQTYFHFPHRLANGEIRIVEVHTGPIKRQNKNYLLSIIHDITNEYQIIEKNQSEFIPSFLFQRIRLLQAIDNIINSISENSKTEIAFIWIDIDHFSNLKKKYPQEELSFLIQKFKEKLKALLNTTIYQIGEDEFGALVLVLNPVRDLRILIKNLFHSFEEPFFINEEKIFLKASLGIFLIQNKELEAKRIFELTSEALLEAKLNGRNTFRISNNEYCAIIKNQLETQKVLELEISNREFDLYCQPILESSKLVFGVECTTKWKNPKLFRLSSHDVENLLLDSEIYEAYLQNFIKKLVLEISDWEREGFSIKNIIVQIILERFASPNELDSFFTILQNINIDKKHFVLCFNISNLQEDKLFLEIIPKIQELDYRICLDVQEISTQLLNQIQKSNVDFIRILLNSFKFLGKKKLDLFHFLYNFFLDSKINLIIHEINTQEEYEKLLSIGYEFFQGDYFVKYHRGRHAITECLARGYTLE